MMMKDTQWMAVGRTCVRAVAVVVPAVMLYCFVCAVSLAQAPGGGEGKTISGPNTAFTLVLPEGWQSVAYDAVADRPNAVRMLAMLSLPETARNTDNLNFWWDAEGEKIESGLASLHRFQTEDELDAPGLLALMEQGGRLPEGMKLSVTRVGKHEAVLGGGPVEDGLYGAVVVIPGGEALYVATIVGPQTEVAPQWAPFVELVGSLDAPDIAEPTPPPHDAPGAAAHAAGTTVSHLGNAGPALTPGATPSKLGWGPDDRAYPDRFTVHPNELGEYVWVPPGEFMMGSADDDRDRVRDETPRHGRTMRGFWVGKHEVTNAQYRAFCEATGREFPSRGHSWAAFSVEADDHPVVFVSWEDAKAYCDHHGLRLPTEAEWEYAARGPEGRRYPWGDEWDPQKLCWQENRGPGGRTSPVGSFPEGASWVGALDMAGNVWEWCADWYDEGAYKRYARGDLAPPAQGKRRVVRGGSWFNDRPAYFFRSTYRNRYDYFVPSYQYFDDGFRCVRGFEVAAD